MNKETICEIETSDTFLEYVDNILFVKIKEGAELTVESTKEQFDAEMILANGNEYVVLVDGTSNHSVSPDARVFMANSQPSNTKAVAIVTNDNLATKFFANFYLRINKPKVPTKVFRAENEAMDWLMKHIEK